MTLSAGTLVQGVAQPNGNKLLALEIGRAVAALMVVFHHADQATAHFSMVDVPRVAVWGQYGVDFFFVLSGFIIYHTHRADPPGATPATRYLSKRLTRIFVPYLPIALSYMALLAVAQPAASRDWGFWASLTLFPMEKSSVLTVAWTLSYELLFYTLFILRYVHRRVFFAVAAIWVAYLLAMMTGLYTGPAEPAIAVALANPIVLEFFCGIAAAYFLPRIKPVWRGPLLAAGLVGLVVVVLTWSGNRVFLAPPISLIVLAGALLKIEPRGMFLRAAVILGAASYAVYLIHSPIISILARLLEPFGWRWGTFLICTTAGVAIGLIYHFIIERPAIRIARTRLHSGSPGRRSANMATTTFNDRNIS